MTLLRSSTCAPQLCTTSLLYHTSTRWAHRSFTVGDLAPDNVYHSKKSEKDIKLTFIKGSQAYFFSFFPNFWRFWYHKKAHISLIIHVKFCGWKMVRLEDINEKYLVMVTIIIKWSLQSNHKGNCNNKSNGLTNLTEILNLHLWCGDPSNEM